MLDAFSLNVMPYTIATLTVVKYKCPLVEM